MSTFRINKKIKENNTNKSSVKPLNLNTSAMSIRPPHTLPTLDFVGRHETLLSSGITSPVKGSKIRDKQPENQGLLVNNYAKVITVRRDTTPIRNKLYHYYLDRFKEPIIVDKFKFCTEQKISTVFSSNGYNQWFSTFAQNELSFKKALFDKVAFNFLSLSTDCCFYTDFSGVYTLNTKLVDNQLVASSNKRVSKATIDFNIESNYINMRIYSAKTQSYVNIRLRPPLRYRPAYGDWVFDEDVNIFDLLSPTEYAKIVDCCNLNNIEIL